MMLTSNPIPTMKTISETAKYFGLPSHFCRRAVLDGKVIYVKAGSKYLVNVDSFASWLNTGDKATQGEQVQSHDKIRQLY